MKTISLNTVAIVCKYCKNAPCICGKQYMDMTTYDLIIMMKHVEQALLAKNVNVIAHIDDLTLTQKVTAMHNRGRSLATTSFEEMMIAEGTDIYNHELAQGIYVPYIEYYRPILQKYTLAQELANALLEQKHSDVAFRVSLLLEMAALMPRFRPIQLFRFALAVVDKFIGGMDVFTNPLREAGTDFNKLRQLTHKYVMQSKGMIPPLITIQELLKDITTPLAITRFIQHTAVGLALPVNYQCTGTDETSLTGVAPSLRDMSSNDIFDTELFDESLLSLAREMFTFNFEDLPLTQQHKDD